MSPTASIIIVNWNGRSHLETCLSALSAQTWRGFEVVVVDNGSTDDSVAWLNGQKTCIHRLVTLGKNLGFAAGNAAGLRVTTPGTELVILLNNDTAPEPRWLECLVAAARAHPDCGAVASLIVTWDGEVVDSAGNGILVTGSGYQRGNLLARACAPKSGYVFGVCAGAALYRRSMLREIGFLDERFFMNGEDTDFNLRARIAGWPAWYCAEAVVRHRGSASQGIWSSDSVYLNQRNQLWSLAKCMPGWLLLKYSWVHVIEQFIHAVYFSRRKRLWPWLCGLWAGVTGCGPFLGERRHVRDSRRISLHEFESLLSVKELFMFQAGVRSANEPK